jgi:translation initiation factor IF-3
LFKKEEKVNKNERIRSEELRIVSENGENLGIKSKEEALSLAREKNLDLIEIAPQAKPPVAKIYSFDKYRYEKKKESQKEKKKTKQKEMKRVQITPRSAKNDLEMKAKKAEGFLKDNHRVEVFIFLKGREKANKDFARQKLEDFLEMIEVEYKQTMQPRYTGRGFITQLSN